MRTSYAEPLRPVRLDASTPDQQSVALRGPSETPALPGRLEDVETTAEDGTRVRSWLCLPEGASADAPAPLLLWIHGGPLGSWNAWSWRWNPWIAVAQGYAVLLPDPALSTGYGLDFVARGWGAWGAAPYTDLMSATDAAVAPRRHRRDPDRRDGRLVRRLHGQLGRRAHRPVQGDRHARLAVGARPVRADDGRALVLGDAR